MAADAERRARWVLPLTCLSLAYQAAPSRTALRVPCLRYPAPPTASCPTTPHLTPMLPHRTLPLLCAIPWYPSRYEHALNKANYASLALRPESTAADDEDAGLDEDDDLYQSLSKWVLGHLE